MDYNIYYTQRRKQHLIISLCIFAATYVLMLIFGKYRPYIALGAALIFIVSGLLPLDKIFPAIDFNVILMIAGTMGLVQLFIDSKMPALLADMIMKRVPNVMVAAVALSLFAGIVSAFIDNVATVLMIAPIALESSRPIPYPLSLPLRFRQTCRVRQPWLATLLR